MIRQDHGLVERGARGSASWREYLRAAVGFGGAPQVRGGNEALKGPWPAPKRGEMEALVHWLALRYPAWGYRKIWALAVTRGYHVSMSTVYRIMLVHEVRYQAERRELA